MLCTVPYVEICMSSACFSVWQLSDSSSTSAICLFVTSTTLEIADIAALVVHERNGMVTVVGQGMQVVQWKE